MNKGREIYQLTELFSFVNLFWMFFTLEVLDNPEPRQLLPLVLSHHKIKTDVGKCIINASNREVSPEEGVKH